MPGGDTGYQLRRQSEGRLSGNLFPFISGDKDQVRRKKENYSTARTFDRAAAWRGIPGCRPVPALGGGFDPHEPFDVPDEFLDKYRECCDFDENFFWPPYDVTDGYTDEQITQIKYRYQALLTMSDYYIGKILDVMDRYDMWKDTAVIFTTDHGYLLGNTGTLQRTICRTITN